MAMEFKINKLKAKDLKIVEYGIATGTELDIICGQDKVLEDGSIQKIRGIRNGTCITLSAISAFGKTTLALNIMGYGLRRYKGSQAVIFDAEGGLTNQYIQTQLGLSDGQIEEQVTYVPASEVSTETVREVFDQIVKNKDLKDTFDTGLKDAHGKPIMGVAPTYILIDSFAALETRNSMEKDAHNMTFAQNIMQNGRLMTDIKRYSKSHNIILLVIAHSGEKINTDMFSSPIKGFQGLKADINIGGGKTLKYHSDIMIYGERYLQGNPEKLEKELGSTGLDYVGKWIIFKSRLSPANSSTYFGTVKKVQGGFDQVESMKYSMKMTFKNIEHISMGRYNFSKTIDPEETPNTEDGERKNFRMSEFNNLIYTDKVFRAKCVAAMEHNYKDIVAPVVSVEEEQMLDLF